MTQREILQDAIQKIQTFGVDDAQCYLSKTTKHEMNVDAGHLSLMRTVFNNHLGLVAIKDKCRGTYAINKLDSDSINTAINQVVEITESSQPDPAHSIATREQEPQTFITGAQTPDLELMYQRLREFMEEVKRRYPKIMLESTYFDYTHRDNYLLNSNRVDFSISKGMYHLTCIFSSSDQENSSSFNYSGFATKDLSHPLIDYGSLDILLKQSSEQTTTKSVPGKFVGDVIIMPDCLGDFLGYLVDISLRNSALISGTSIYKDKIGQQIADPRLTVHSRPIADEIADGYFITGDGFLAQNSTIIDRGILKTYLLSLYGANKTGMPRAVNDGGSYVVEPGDASFEEMVSKVDRGILLARYSGGNPSQNGDFSGVAKNSYYIENGQIKYPISETMVAGNLADMLQNINAISQERINFGSCIFPWISCSNITISGK